MVDLYRYLYNQLMKTTLNIHDTLLVEAKALAARQRSTLTRLIEEGLRMRLRAAESLPVPAKRKPMPVFRGKGRIRVGADADITVFDPATVIDKSTYQQPALPSVGFRYVLVNGVPVVDEGRLADGRFPGRGERAAIR